MYILTGKKKSNGNRNMLVFRPKKTRLIVSENNGPHMQVLLAKHCNDKYSKPTVVVVVAVG